MDQTIAGATLLALAFFLYQVVKGRRDARKKRQDEEARKQQLLDDARHQDALPRDVIDRMRQQRPTPRRRKKR